MRRRDFIVAIGGAAALPVAARAQQRSMPVVGYLDGGTAEVEADNVAAFRKGLSEAGFVEGRNVAIEFRFAGAEPGRLPDLAADLVRRRVSVIAADGLSPALAAKGATATIPIVFRSGGDPVEYGLVASFNRPGGNLTGLNDIGQDLGPKRLQLLHDLLPGASRFAVLIADQPLLTIENQSAQLQAAAASLGRFIDVISASTPREIETAFASLASKRIDALVVTETSLFINRRTELVTLAAYHHLPAIYPWRDATYIGGLMSYGADYADEHRRAGVYVGRILKGEKPSDLPVMRPVKFEFVINLQTARILGIEVPPLLLAITDIAIE
jgi:putative tryptophan/tyrosine transport system substrate-binding protein